MTFYTMIIISRILLAYHNYWQVGVFVSWFEWRSSIRKVYEGSLYKGCNSGYETVRAWH